MELPWVKEAAERTVCQWAWVRGVTSARPWPLVSSGGMVCVCGGRAVREVAGVLGRGAV